MSQIFDALHQSAAERNSSGPHIFSAAKELLQEVEQKAALPATPEVLPSGQVSCPASDYPMADVSLAAGSKVVCLTQTESLAAEKFRFLATRMRHIQQKRSLKRVVVTSSVAGEGKSMVAANLACALGSGKQNILLVEGDLRRPSLAPLLGLAELPGLAQILQGGMERINHIYRLKGTGAYVVLAGRVVGNPLELMQPEKLSLFMDRVSDHFDWIVIDCPPVLPLADTSIWMRLADAIMMVTRPGFTSKRQLQRSLEVIEPSRLLGAILNASSEATTSNYYYNYGTNARSSSTPQISVK